MFRRSSNFLGYRIIDARPSGEPNLFFWSPYVNKSGLRNFGDELSAVIVEGVLGRPIKKFIPFDVGRFTKRNYRQKVMSADVSFQRYGRLFAIGSIVHQANEGDIIWGTGALPNRLKGEKSMAGLDIRALRGPLTKKFLNENNAALKGEVTFGDPGVLISEFFDVQNITKRREIGVIPQLFDIGEDIFTGLDVCLPTAGWQNVVRYIAESEAIVSSSLHGLIVAESFGIPCRWLRNENMPSYTTDPSFKYNDYYAGTGRNLVDDFAETYEEAARQLSKPPDLTAHKAALLNAFPHEKFV